MFFAEKRIKLQSIKTKKVSEANSSDQGIESDFNSQVDFANSSADFSLPQVKRKSKISRQVSFSSSKRKQSFDLADPQQTSLGYSSLLSSSASPHKSQNRTPKKRKLAETESDENAFYNSYEFVSPLKLRKKDPSDTMMILKEKSCSENVILSSTPILSSNRRTKWGKFRSLHPEKFDERNSLDKAQPIQIPPFMHKSSEESFDNSSFDFTSSINLTSSAQQHESVPSSLDDLWTGSIKVDHVVKPRAALPTETITKSQEKDVSASSAVSSQNRTESHCGRKFIDILGRLQMGHNEPLNKILSHLSDTDLIRLSGVSKDYRNIVTSNNPHGMRRQNYLRVLRSNQENNRENKPANTCATKQVVKPSSPKSRRRAFADSNINHSMQLRSKPQSPPVSPSRRRFDENQKVAKSYSGLLSKCPRCRKPAKINTIKIRRSPRKKKKKGSSILDISSVRSGRVQKRSTSFLAKPSIDAQFSYSEQLYVTFPTLSNSSPSSSGSPCSPSSDESSGGETSAETTTYEYGECTGISCNFKFCVKCNCKYHPRQPCKELSPASPTRGFASNNNKSVACSSRSFKSLKRLADFY